MGGRNAFAATLVSLLLLVCVAVAFSFRATFKPIGLPVAARDADQRLDEPNEDDGRDLVASSLRHVPIFPKAIRSVAFSPDAKWLAIGAGDGVIRLFDLPTKTVARTVVAHPNWVFDLTFGPTGTLVSGGGDNTVVFIDPETGEILERFEDHNNDLHGVAVTPDGDWLICGGDDQMVLARSLKHRTVQVLGQHDKQVTSVTLSSDGALAASSSRDGTVRLWDLKTMKPARDITGHTADVMSVAFSPDGSTLATGSYDKTVRLWKTETGQQIREFSGHNHWVFAVLFLPDGQHLLTGCGDGKLRMFRVSDGKLIDELDLIADVADLAVTPDGSLVAAGASNGLASLFSVTPTGLKALPNQILMKPTVPIRRQPVTTNITGYLESHAAIVNHAPGWSEVVARMSQQGDAFTLHLLRKIDNATLPADEAELHRRVIEQIEARRGEHPEKIRLAEINPMLLRTGVADLTCHSLEHELRRWAISELQSQVNDPSVRDELESIRINPPLAKKEDAPDWRLVRDRISLYAKQILSSDRTERAKQDD